MRTGKNPLEFKITSAIINVNLQAIFVENSLSEILVVRTILILKIINGIGNAISAAKNQYS